MFLFPRLLDKADLYGSISSQKHSRNTTLEREMFAQTVSSSCHSQMTVVHKVSKGLVPHCSPRAKNSSWTSCFNCVFPAPLPWSTGLLHCAPFGTNVCAFCIECSDGPTSPPGTDTHTHTHTHSRCARHTHIFPGGLHGAHWCSFQGSVRVTCKGGPTYWRWQQACSASHCAI